MDLFQVITERRSIRKFTTEIVPDDVINKALDAAILAPNSSNTQTWNFFWVKSVEKKEQLVINCLSQSAARTAQQLVVITANPALWRRSQKPLAEFVKSVQAPKQVIMYYEKLIPIVYRWGFLNCLVPIKWILSTCVGFFKPTLRGPYSKRDLQEVSIKSAALAAENFALAITAQGFSTCMMEGFDESRVKSLLNLKSSERVVMVIAVGKEADHGTWGPRFRIERSEVVFEV
ncbi:MAG: nitroreductase family protein [Pseudobdellovibrio sp.]